MKKYIIPLTLVLSFMLYYSNTQAQTIKPPSGLQIVDIDDDPESIKSLSQKSFKNDFQAKKEQVNELEKTEKDLEHAKKEELTISKKPSLHSESKLNSQEELLLKKIIAFINVVARDLEVTNPCDLVSYVSIANAFRVPLPYIKLYLASVSTIDQNFFDHIKIAKDSSLERKGIALLSAINLQQNSTNAMKLAEGLLGQPLTNKMRNLLTAGINKGGIKYINQVRIAEEEAHLSYKIANEYCIAKLSS